MENTRTVADVFVPKSLRIYFCLRVQSEHQPTSGAPSVDRMYTKIVFACSPSTIKCTRADL